MGAIIIRREWPTLKKGHGSQAMQAMACMHARAWAVKARHGRRAMVKVFRVRFSLAQLNWRQDSALAPVELARTKGTNNEVRLFSSIVHSNGNFSFMPEIAIACISGLGFSRDEHFSCTHTSNGETTLRSSQYSAELEISKDHLLARPFI